MASEKYSAQPLGVLLANTGTPEEATPRAVKRYLAKFLMDPRIRPMNRVAWWFILHLFILPKRSKASAAKYERIWTEDGSPLLVNQEMLTAGLQAYYRRTGQNVIVAQGYSYSNPSIQAGMKELIEKGCNRIIVLPLYPQSAYCTVGSIRDGVDKAVKKLRFKGRLEFIDNYSEDPIYIKALASSIINAGFDPEGNDRLLFSYHSIPLTDIEAGDTYELQTGSSSLHIASELGLDRKRWTISYQSRFDKGRDWLQPFTKDVINRWARAGEGRVFVVCPNFAVDCLETLYDVDIELRELYAANMRDLGEACCDDDYVFVPCLNKSKAHLRVLTHVLEPYVS